MFCCNIKKCLEVFALAGVMVLVTGSVHAEELAKRKDMSALERAKVQSVMSKRWLGFGVTQKTTDTATAPAITESGIRSSINSTVCTTNIGVPQDNNTGLSAGRYGPSANKDNIVVVTGDVISICK